MEDATALVQPSMFTRPTTLHEYLSFNGAIEITEQRPEIQTRISVRRAEVEELLQAGSELWEWSRGQAFAAIGGLAVVREGIIIKAWRDWRS